MVVIAQHSAGVVGAFHRSRIWVSWTNSEIGCALIGVLTDAPEAGAAVLFHKTARWIRTCRWLRWFR